MHLSKFHGVKSKKIKKLDNSKCVSLVLIGLLLRQPFDNLFAIKIPDWLLPKIRAGLIALLLFIAVMTAIDLIKNLVILGRKKLAQ